MAVLEVFADVSCPYAHVQLRQLMSVRSEGSASSFRIRSWPLELVNGGTVDHASLGQGVAALRAHVDPGLFAGFDATHRPDTFLPALDLEQAAWRQDPSIGEQVSLQLRDAFFVDGRDISDPAVLESIAARHDLGVGPTAREIVLADWRDGTARGVEGSPHFFCAERSEFSPGLDMSNENGEKRVTTTIDQLRAFVRACSE